MSFGWRRSTTLGAWLVAGLLGAASAAHAQLIDSVDVQRSGKEARISIRFTTTVQYLRNTPPQRGKTLLIYLQVTGVAALSPAPSSPSPPPGSAP